MAEKLLETLEVEPGGQAQAAVIWLHGLGADGRDFQPIVPELGLPQEARIRFVFPHAPYRPVTINGGMAMRAWYDLLGVEAGSPQDAAGIQDSERRLRELIDREIRRGVPAERIVLAGFSQGGALALYTGLRYPQRLAGIMGLSTYLPLHQAMAESRAEGNAETPIFMAHGHQDPVLPFELGDYARRWLQARGYPVEWREYAMGHQVCWEEIQAIAAWLQQVLAEPPR
ncbi:MAG: alpha/beta fold hydrolase [Nitrococcus mobilis]|nr:alpha/beta fold hydrolase [Nitrococcus mobilis]